jgi:hypothetical protein
VKSKSWIASLALAMTSQKQSRGQRPRLFYSCAAASRRDHQYFIVQQRADTNSLFSATYGIATVM